MYKGFIASNSLISAKNSHRHIKDCRTQVFVHTPVQSLFPHCHTSIAWQSDTTEDQAPDKATGIMLSADQGPRNQLSKSRLILRN